MTHKMKLAIISKVQMLTMMVRDAHYYVEIKNALQHWERTVLHVHLTARTPLVGLWRWIV